MNWNKIIYWLFTGLLCAWMSFMAIRFLVQFELTKEFFASLYVTPILVAPLAVLKLLAVIAVITNESRVLKQLAYNGLVIDYLAALFVHTRIADGIWPMPAAALVLAIVSYIFWRKVYKWPVIPV